MTDRPERSKRASKPPPRASAAKQTSKEGALPPAPPYADIERLVARDHHNPHALLGAHPEPRGGVMIRALQPAAESVTVQGVELHRVHPGGLFEGVLPDASLPLRYELEIRYPDGNTFTTPDPYSFPPTLSDLDEHLFREGRHEQLWSKMGAHVREIDGAQGTSFAVWAPAARKTDTANKQTSEKTHNGKTGRNREQGKEKQKTKEKQIVIKRKCKRR